MSKSQAKNNWQAKLYKFIKQIGGKLKMITRSFWKFIKPVIYLFLWILLIKLANNLSLEINNLFLLISLVILLFGIISRSTSWSIGHEKFGIKADSTSKKVEFCADGIGTIKIFEDDLIARERLMEKAGKIIKKLKEN